VTGSRNISKLELPALPDGLSFPQARMADPQFDFQARSDGGVIEIFAPIGFEGASPERVSSALRAIGPKPVTVKINSPGGDFFAGSAIFNLLREHAAKAQVTTRVLGLAASAASIVAMAGDRIEMAKTAELFVHRAWVMTIGDVEVHLKATEILNRIDGSIAQLYAARSGQSVEKAYELMAAETFMNADEAKTLGFADEILDEDALPKPPVNSMKPQTRRQLEATLRGMGFARAAAEKIAGAGWAALEGDGDLDLTLLAERIDASTREIRNL
jgi:ATP-dependent protease ClpP protease subunit